MASIRIGAGRFRKFSLILLAALSCLLGPAASGQNADQATTSELQLTRLSTSLENSIQSEKSAVSDLAGDVSRMYTLEKSIKMGIDVFNLQRASFQSLMILPQVPARQLDGAFAALQVAYNGIHEQYEKLGRQKTELERAIELTEDQLTSIDGQQQGISALIGREKQAGALFKKTVQLKQLISAKQKSYRQLHNHYAKLSSELEKTQQVFPELSRQYRQTQAKRNSRELFHRSVSLFSSQWPSFVARRFLESGIRSGIPVNRQYWQSRFGLDQPSRLYVTVSLLLLLLIVAYFGRRLSGFLSKPQMVTFFERYPSSFLPSVLLQKTAVILLITVFLAIYLEAIEVSGLSSVIRLAVDLLTVWIISSWALIFITSRETDLSGGNRLIVILKRLLLFLRWFGISFLVLSWIFHYDQALIMFGRYFLELALVGFSLTIWQTGKGNPEIEVGQAENRAVLGHLFSALMPVIALTGLVLEMAGFGSMALFWYVSWGRSGAVVLWGWLSAAVLKELAWVPERQEKQDIESFSMAASQGKWLLVRLLQLSFPLLLMFAAILAWGGRQFFQENVHSILSYSFKIGDIAFSLLSIIQAVLVLLTTHIITRVWRLVLQKRFFRRSHMEVGLKDSVTAITVYLIWGLGIILALNTFGMNPTSLVVVFGALGIGLGFGLQNIFNNFMSGLILLFERPIQVGDDIEINGVFASVRKINVRSTLVQTYDNASLIIPNSELINSQVTNWSFKDRRLRRKITVGVAYGSDIELVRKTLLEVAVETRNVLKHPAPDVLFSDFGDSALIFILRFWTYVDVMLETDTSVRFKIDAAFRRNGITIAFPQQDVHLHTIATDEQKKS